MLKLIIGTDWVSIRKQILQSIALDVSQKRDNRILLVPELISHDMERRLCSEAGDTASRYAQVLSFTRLVRCVKEYTKCGAPPCLDNGGRVIAMAAAAQQLHSKLKAYAAVETKPEFLLQLLDAVDEWKRCCISPEDLAFAAKQLEGSFAQKLEELSLLYGTYDALCNSGKRDPRDQLDWLLGQLEDCDFAQQHVIYIDGFPDFTRQNLAVISHFIQNSELVVVGLNCDMPGSKAFAFEKAGQTASELLQLAKNANIPFEVVSAEENTRETGFVCRSLFQGSIPKINGALTTFQSDSPAVEVQTVAAKIMNRVTNGCRFRDIGVVCSDMSVYAEYFRMIFPRFGIPIYLTGTENVLDNPVIATLLFALDAAVGGFEQRAVLRYLRSPLSGISADDCDALENYAVLWGIQGKRWLEDWTQHPDGLSGVFTQQTQQQLDTLNQIRKEQMKPLHTLRSVFQDSKNLSQQIKGLYVYLNKVQYANRLNMLAREMDAQGDNRSAQILNQLWEILLSALEQMHDILGKTYWEPDHFVALLKLLLSQYDVGTIPPVLDAVNIGSVSTMRCQQQKHVFVLGASEGSLPGYAGSQGLLSDQERLALRNLGVPLTGGAMEGIQAEFAEIYGVFCGAELSITVSYSDSQPSFVFQRLAKMTGNVVHEQAGLGSAEFDKDDAVAYLLRKSDPEAALSLNLQEDYAEMYCKKIHTFGSISQNNINGLYGGAIKLSASQIDTQAQCRLSYFLKYGMGAKERKEATVDPAEFGSYVHAVLERTAKQVMQLGGFHEVSLEKTIEIALDFSDEYIRERFSQMDSNRLRYLLHRNQRELEMVVSELWQELKLAAFEPTAFELGFGKNGQMSEISIRGKQMQADLRGFVDRVDVWENNGKHYFRVVDYKTGKKDFDYCDVFNGVGLQMLLYLFALEQNGQAIIGRQPEAAGVQYFPARVPILSVDGRLTQEEAEQQRKKDWTRKGLLLNEESVLSAMDDEQMNRLCCTRKKDGSISGDVADKKQLSALRSYVFQLLADMVDEIASGNVSPNPYTRGMSYNACTYCPYGSICNHQGENQRRDYKKMDADRFWEEIDKEVAHNG